MAKRAPRTFEEIEAVIGKRAARSLVERFGGQKIWVPTTRRYDLEKRNRMIIEALNRGTIYRTVAERYGVSLRHVKCLGKGT